MFSPGDHVRTTRDITRRTGIFRDEIVVPAGSVGRVVSTPFLASRVGVTFAVGVGVFHDEQVPAADLERVR